MKLQASAGNFIKKEALVQMFSCEFCEIFTKNFLQRTATVTASKNQHNMPAKSSGDFVICIPAITQPAITCSKLTIETLEQGVKYVQS